MQASDTYLVSKAIYHGSIWWCHKLEQQQLTFALTAQPHMTHCDNVFSSFHYITTFKLLVLYWSTHARLKVSSFLVHKHNTSRWIISDERTVYKGNITFKPQGKQQLGPSSSYCLLIAQHLSSGEVFWSKYIFSNADYQRTSGCYLCTAPAAHRNALSTTGHFWGGSLRRPRQFLKVPITFKMLRQKTVTLKTLKYLKSHCQQRLIWRRYKSRWKYHEQKGKKTCLWEIPGVRLQVCSMFSTKLTILIACIVITCLLKA